MICLLRGDCVNIGENIKKYRKKANLTQRELAEKCDVAVGTIQQYELGKRTPRAEIAFKIASTLGISAEDLYSGMTTQQLTKEIIGMTAIIESGSQILKQMAERALQNMPNNAIDTPITDEFSSKKLTQNEAKKIELTPTQATLQILNNALDEQKSFLCSLKSSTAKRASEKLLEYFNSLNQDGQEKAVELVELLTKVPEYQKNTNTLH